MKILLLGTPPETTEHMEWIENQPADLIVFAQDSSNPEESESPRSWVIRFPEAAGKLEGTHGTPPQWLYELRHLRLAGSPPDVKKSIPVVFLPWPVPGRGDDWFAAAKQNFVDISDSVNPWILVTHSASTGPEWPCGRETMVLDLCGVERPRITVSGVTRAPKVESRWLRIAAGVCDGNVPQHAWIGSERTANR